MPLLSNLSSKQKSIIEIIAVAFILLTLWGMRSVHLDADPPVGLSASTDVYTDPTQYTLFSKQNVQTGEFNPYNDNRFVFFLKSSVTLLSLLIFKLFGVSLFASNLTGLIYSFGALLLFYLIIRKAANPLAGILFLIFIGVNYNQIFYGRLPFLEHAMAFYAFLSMTLLLYFRNIVVAIFAGVFLAVGIFFGKVIGLVFVAPFFIYFLYHYLYEDKKILSRFLGFTGGFTTLTIFWFFFSYLPMTRQVSTYLGEQAVSLYGAPEAFDSFGDFIFKYVSFGGDSHLFERMPVVGILAVIFIAIFIYHAIKKDSYKNGFPAFNSGQIFLVVMIIAFFFSLMIWNYRPLRYQLVLIYPMCGAAAILLSRLWNKDLSISETKVPYYYLPFLYFLILPPVYQLYKNFVSVTEISSLFDEQKYLIAGWTLVITSLIYWVIIYWKQKKFKYNPLPGYILTFGAVIIVGSLSLSEYLDWEQRPTFSTRDNSTDLTIALSPGAVLSGPYAPTLTTENNLGTVIHMFGVSQADPDLFKKYPITHLLLDSGNESRAKKDYSDILDSAAHLITYHVGYKKVRLYRIAGFTGNPSADNYKLSPFERLVDEFAGGEGTINNDLAVEIISQSPDNISCYSFLAEAAEQDSIYQLAEMMFKKAVEFSPTNYNLNARLAKFYQDLYNETKVKQYKIESRHYYEEAIRFAPTVTKLKRSLEELNRS